MISALCPTSFDLVLFRIPKYSGSTGVPQQWDSGVGYDYYDFGTTNLNDRSFSDRPSNWFQTTTLSGWSHNGIYDNTNSLTGLTGLNFTGLTIVDTQHIEFGNENIEIRPFLSESSFARTSSFGKPLANYSQKYQVVQIPGREVNKKYLVKKQGVLSSSVASTAVDGLYDYPEENKTSYRTVMVTKFSSPGGLEVSSKTSLDRESETFSAYNSINYRNLVARKNLDKWLAETGSYEQETVSYHKTNKTKDSYLWTYSHRLRTPL